MVAVARADDGLRLDRWFKQHYPALTHGQLQKMLRKGQVRVDGGRVDAARRLAPGETVRVPPMPDAAPPRAAPSRADPNEVRALVLWEDEHTIALNKPFGLPVQGGSKVTRHLDGMLDGLARKGERPRLVHRLDKDTGGLLLLGKTRASAKALGDAFQRHEIDKTYWALTAGVPHPLQGRIDAPVGKTGEPGEERVTQGGGKRALTDYQVVESAGTKAAFVALRPLTGRTHQLRVHMQALGTPIIGDGKYGGARAKAPGLAPRLHLFCRTMTFPSGGRRVAVEAPLTGHMTEAWRFLSLPDEPDLEWPET